MSIVEYNYVCIKDKIVTLMNITCVNYVNFLPWGATGPLLVEHLRDH
jgi:hypothetical protein